MLPMMEKATTADECSRDAGSTTPLLIKPPQVSAATKEKLEADVQDYQTTASQHHTLSLSLSRQAMHE
jgi:hypothetical protein